VAKARAWLLIALFSAVLLYGSASLAGDRFFSAYAYFTDTAADTGNTITAATLAAPTLSTTASPDTAPGTVTLTWTLPSADPATQIQIYRATGSCAAFDLLDTVARTPASYADTNLAAGAYCYKVRGKLLNWTSGFSDAKSETIKSSVTCAGTMRLHANGQMDAASSSPGVVLLPSQTFGSYTWECLPAVGSSLPADPKTLKIVQDDRPDAGNGATATVEIGYGLSCSTMAVLSTTSIDVPKVGIGNGLSYALNAGAGHTFTEGQKLCLRITNASQPPSSSRDIGIRTDSASTSGVPGVSSLGITLSGP
jgi:hypothetical protein